jgi:ribonuclease VapC
VVVDTSALLAVLFNERHGPWVADRLEEHRETLRMSVVNLAETLILVEDRQPQLFEEIRASILSSPVRFVPPTVEHARIAAAARSRFPLNLGDCFAYALAVDEDCPILTLDRDFRRTDITVVQPR